MVLWTQKSIIRCWFTVQYHLEQVSFIFEHDNDPKRVANAVKRVMDWPPQSLELNIIEEEWDQKTE